MSPSAAIPPPSANSRRRPRRSAIRICPHPTTSSASTSRAAWIGATATGIVETSNFDYQAKDIVALVARVLVDDIALDVYVTHLFMSRGDDSLRLFQVQQLLAWIDTRDDVAASIVCGDFNATLDVPSAALMATRYRPTQREPTAFTPLADSDGSVSHPDRPRTDRCIDYIWVAGAIRIVDSGVCFNQPSSEDPSLWPSDHIGVWADLEFGG